MTGDAQVIYARHDNAVLVPERALRVEGSRHIVNLLDGNKVVAQPVTVGVSDGQLVEILSGLKPGALVVVPVTAPNLPALPTPGPAGK
jgi:HlyD family secretion protein